MRKLYRGVDGYDIPADDVRQVRRSRGAPTYGELTLGSVDKLLDYLDMGRRDSFYDLGAGTGKVVLQTAISRPIARCIGIELAPTRYRSARTVLTAARRQGLIRARACRFRNEDLMTTSLDDATVVYTCSTSFSRAFMNRLTGKLVGLQRELLVVSLQALEPRRRLALIDTLRLGTSWDRRSPVYVYRIAAPPRRRPR